MSQSNCTHDLFVSLLISLLTFTLHISAAIPPPLIAISNLITLPTSNSSVGGINPPQIAVEIDSTHNIYFTEYRHLVPERNYFAAVLSFQTSLTAEFFERREETLETGGVGLDVYGAHIYLDNPTGRLTYVVANLMLGELGEFLMERNLCTARFELWEVRGRDVRQLSEGGLVPERSAKAAV